MNAHAQNSVGRTSPTCAEGMGGGCNIGYAAVDRHAYGPAADRTALRLIFDTSTTEVAAAWCRRCSNRQPVECAFHDGRATITGMRADSATAELTEPSNIPANPPRPWLPTTVSCADSDCLSS
jgi:hypothetical protein